MGSLDFCFSAISRQPNMMGLSFLLSRIWREEEEEVDNDGDPSIFIPEDRRLVLHFLWRFEQAPWFHLQGQDCFWVGCGNGWISIAPSDKRSPLKVTKLDCLLRFQLIVFSFTWWTWKKQRFPLTELNPFISGLRLISGFEEAIDSFHVFLTKQGFNLAILYRFVSLISIWEQ